MIIFIYGPDSWQGQQKVLELKTKFIKEVDQAGNAWSSVTGADLTMKELNDLLSANSLFTSKRLLIIKDILSANKTFLAELVDYLPQLSNSGHIIIVHETRTMQKKQKTKNEVVLLGADGEEKKMNKEQKVLFDFLSGQQYVQYFALLDSRQAVAWANNKLTANNLQMDYQAGQLLVGILGNDLWLLNNETDKLIAYKQAQGQTQVTVADIEIMAHGILDQGIFALTDALSNKDKALALKLLADQQQLGLPDMYLITMLLRQFRILLQIRQGLDSGLTNKDLASTLQLHPYVLQKGINQARNFNLNSLKNLFNALTRVDYNYKTGKLPVETMVDLIIARL